MRKWMDNVTSSSNEFNNENKKKTTNHNNQNRINYCIDGSFKSNERLVKVHIMCIWSVACPLMWISEVWLHFSILITHQQQIDSIKASYPKVEVICTSHFYFLHVVWNQFVWRHGWLRVLENARRYSYVCVHTNTIQSSQETK